MLEGDYTSKIILPSIIAKVGGCWWKIHGGASQESGIPDLVGVVSSRFIGIEVKRPDNKKGCSKMQEYQIERIRRHGGVGIVVRTPEDVHRLLSLHGGKYIGELEEPWYR